MEHELCTQLLKKDRYSFEDLKIILQLLRGENGCPWDREQDHHSIRANLIEETYEVVEAIDNDDPVLLREELGDLLFQIFFHAELEKEVDHFTVEDVVDEICKKMITRHPHVFGDVSADTTAEVLKNWDAIKSEEKQRLSLEDKLRAIPPMLPSLMRASKVIKKSKKDEETSAEDLLVALRASVDGLETKASALEIRASDMGQLLLSVTALCAKLGIDGEEALQKATDGLIDTVAKA